MEGNNTRHDQSIPTRPESQNAKPSFARKHFRRFAIAAGIVAVASLAFVMFADRYIAQSTESRVYRDVHTMPNADVALVLGTAKRVQGRPNMFYNARLSAAADLYHAGKVRGILVSGDHGRPGYNEPGDMKADLIAAGVPAEYITQDFAGFRTLDSVVRAREVFGQSNVIIVSQPFHAQRALFLADSHGLNAVAYAAEDAGGAAHAKIRLRESLARTAAVLDVYVLGREPRFYGPDEHVALADATQPGATRLDATR